MTVPGNIDALLLGGLGGYQIERSLRFNGAADSTYLNRTPGSAGNRKTWTWSGWIKRSRLSTADEVFFNSNGGTDSTRFDFFWISNDTFEIDNYNTRIVRTTQVFRDPSAWYHLVVALDTTQATASNRLRVYVNGQEITSFSIDNRSTAISQNADMGINGTTQHNVGGYTSYHYNGYMTEVHLIDGQALTPSSFGETDTITGVWKPKRYAGTYGTNGFYLKFADNSGTTSTTLGKDSSGNGNNWTPNNFSVTAGAGNDSLIDTPTPYADGGNGRGNYCTLNPLDTGSATLTNGNLDVSTPSSGYGAVRGTIGVSSGKWYWEVTPTSLSAGTQLGIAGVSASFSSSTQIGLLATGYSYLDNGDKYGAGVYTSSYGASFTTSDVIGVALDLDAGTLTFYKNGTSQGSAFTGLSGTFSPAISDNSGSAGSAFTFNFGQRSFSYTPPAGFSALNTQNLPEPTIKKPSSYMDVVTWTGNATYPRAITGLNFSPDLLWIKSRSNAYDNVLMDAVRGTGNTKWLSSNLTDAEGTNSNNANVTSLDSAGFTIGTTGGTNILNASGVTNVAWCWDESATPGFDIVTYTGDGTTSANRLIDHSLGVKPDFVVTKKRSSGTDYGWSCWHKDLGGNYGIWLDKTSARNSGMWTGYSNFSATKFTPPDLSYGNETSQTYVNYLWSEVAGFSKFGSYTGNGSSDGSFVFCGFRPKVVWFKRTDSTGSWFIEDSARGTYNAMGPELYANSADAETTVTRLDFLSNGFKMRAANAGDNASGGTYIFCAWAESPFKYSLAR